MHISIVFSVVCCETGQNMPTIFTRKSQNAPNVAAGQLWASHLPLRLTPVSSIALVEGDPLPDPYIPKRVNGLPSVKLLN